jgi:hypothetical protein
MARFTVAERNAYLDARTPQYNNGTIKFYSGTRPADADTAITDQVLLATCTFPADAFGDAALGVATAGTIVSDSAADAAGIVSFARLASSGGTALCDLSVGYTGGSEEIILASGDGLGHPYITVGSVVSVSACTLTCPVGA